MNKKLCAAMIALSVGVVAATVGFSKVATMEKVDLLNADSYKLALNNGNVPTEVAGVTSSSPASFTSKAVNENIPVKYYKVFEPTTGHVSIAGGGNVECSSAAAENIDDIDYVKVSFSSGGALLRYGLSGEIHQIHITSGETYRIAGNWFMVRNESNSAACENVNIEVSYPCTHTEFTRPNNTYFDETFDNVETFNENACFDNYGTTAKWTTNSVADGVATIDCGGVNYDNCVNTYGKFTGAYSFSVRVKFNSANTQRLMLYVGKDVYNRTYNQIVADTTKGSAIEINTSNGMVRLNNAVTLYNIKIKAPRDFFSVFTISVDASHHIYVYQDCELMQSFTSAEYTTDGYCGFGCGTGGESKFILDGMRTEAAPSGDFECSSFVNTASNNFILANRGGAAYARVADGVIKTYLNNDNLYTANTFKDVEVEFGFKNTSKARIELVFGNTSPTNTGYAPGENMGTGRIAVVVADTFVRYYDNSATLHDTPCTLPTKAEFVNVKITLNGTSLKVVCNNNTIVDATVTALTDAGHIVVTRGTDAAEIEISKFKVTSLA